VVVKRQVWKAVTTTASTSLATASTSAASTGLDDLAEASRKVRYAITNDFEPAQNPEEEISETQLKNLISRLTEFETQIQTYEEAKPMAFECQRACEECLTGVTTWDQKISCWMAYAACLARDVTSFARLRE
jgi:predicted ATP-binding protein involved in virulence